jgi:hypothetical protein
MMVVARPTISINYSVVGTSGSTADVGTSTPFVLGIDNLVVK